MQAADTIRALTHRLPAVTASGPDAVAPPGMRHSAVLILLHSVGGEICFPVTERPETLTHHPGQVVLPGGAVERTDASRWGAALRETREELGIVTAGICPVGHLAAVPVTASGFVIYPFVGWIERLPQLHPDPREVARLAQVPLSALADPAAVREEERRLRLGRCVVTYYDVAGLKIWGATARILAELAGHLGAREGPYPPGCVRPVAG